MRRKLYVLRASVGRSPCPSFTETLPHVLLIVLLYVVYKQKCQHSHQASLEVCNSQPGSTCSRLPHPYSLTLSLLALSLNGSLACSLSLSPSSLSDINCTLQLLLLLLLLLLFMLFCLYFILYFSMRFFAFFSHAHSLSLSYVRSL